MSLQAVAVAGSGDARVTGVDGGAYPAPHKQGYTSATDADEKVKTTNTYPYPYLLRSL